MPGREGPDISLNELELVINVKDRDSNPKSMMINEGVCDFGDFLGEQVGELPLLLAGEISCTGKPSTIVCSWWVHMDKSWKDFVSSGIYIAIPDLQFSGEGLPAFRWGDLQRTKFL